MKIWISVFAVFFVCTLSNGQAFNINCVPLSTDPVPSSTYGAAAGQTGLWNNARSGFEFPLTDVEGNSTSARVATTAGGFNTLNVPTSNMDELRLMRTVFALNFLDNYITVLGIQPGWYDLYIYCWSGPGNRDFTAAVSVGGGVQYGIATNSGQPWPGGQVEGITYAKVTIFAQQGGFGIDTSPPLNGFYLVSGLQLVPVPAPGGLAFLAGGGLLACAQRRR